MLSAQERNEIEKEIKHYPNLQAVTIDALKIVQKHRGWVSDDSLEDLASFLGMTVEDLDGVATFYNRIYRRPVGRHVIHICDSISCWLTGYENALQVLKDRLGIGLGETTPDGRFTLLTIPCLGHCDHAPALMIDDDMHCHLDPEKIGEILEKYE